MHESIRKALRGELGAYVQALVVALLLAATIYAVVFGTGCYEPVITSTITSWESQRRSNWRPDFQVRLRANAQQARPGERATRTLGGTGDPGTTQVSYRWTPPWGATNVSFPPGSEPYPGSPPYDGPPYVWLDRDPSQEIHMEYDQPNLPPGESTMLATDTAVAEWNGHSSATSYTTLITNEALRLTISPPQAAAYNSPAATAELWEVVQWTDPRGVTLTTELCQDWFELFQGDDAFLAMRAPVSPTVTLTEGYPLPIVFGGPYSNTFKLIEYGGWPQTTHLTVPVELRPERHTFLESELPSAPGEHWMALGLVSETITCPTSALAADNWGFLTQGYLDLTHQPNNCERCVIPFYHCYEGQEAPLLTAAYSALGGRDVTSYQGWGITCLGPYAASLVDESVWHLGGASMIWVTPTLPITLHHYIQLEYGSDPMTFTLAYTDTLGVEWNVYDGDWTDPDLGVPIIPPFPVTWEDWQHLWFVSEPVPNGTDPGAHSLFITATSIMAPYEMLWASDQIWVGQWVAPPPPIEHRMWIYLPLVARSH